MQGPAALASMMRDEGFWKAIAGPPDAPRTARSFDASVLDSVRRALRTEGYFRLDGVFAPGELAFVEHAIGALHRFGLPALFVFAYESPWDVFTSLGALLGGILGQPYRPLAAFWAWRVDPASEESGWPKHRDRSSVTLDANGDPKVVTLWVSVTEATLDNGCIRVVPAPRDPDYADPSKTTVTGSVACDEAAVPLLAEPGTVLGWTHQLVHWGGRASKAARVPRISLSAEFQRADGAPLDDVLAASPPSLEERLALIGAQLLKYRHIQSPNPSLLTLAQTLCTR